jgi:hypothetical protein
MLARRSRNRPRSGTSWGSAEGGAGEVAKSSTQFDVAVKPLLA